MSNTATSQITSPAPAPAPAMEDEKLQLLKQVSYSSLLTFHACPRKFQLDKLRANVSSEEESPGSIHFEFGHAVGAGIQQAFLPETSLDLCYWKAFLAWDMPLLGEMEKAKKSFWYALHAIDAAWHLAVSMKAEGWELAYFDGKPAIEYSFRVEFPGGYQYRAYVDLILFNPGQEKYKIVEVKTTGASWLHEAQYGNSAQALSYGIILDWLVKDLSSYEVLYLVYKTKTQEWEALPFQKTKLVKSEWIRNVLIDCEQITKHVGEDYFPKHGESCFAYFQPCQYFGTCGYSDEFLGLSSRSRLADSLLVEQEKRYDVDISLEELLKHQLLTLEDK